MKWKIKCDFIATYVRQSGYGLGSIIVITLAVIVVYSMVTAPKSTGGLGGPTTVAKTNVTGICNPAPTLQYAAQYYNALANSGAGGWTQAASATNVFTPGYLGGQTALATGTSSATASSAFSTTIQCGVTYTFFGGANGAGDTFWPNITTVPAPYSTSFPVTMVLNQAFPANIYFKNATNGGFLQTASGTGGLGAAGSVDKVSTGQILSGGAQISVEIQAGQGYDCGQYCSLVFVGNTLSGGSVTQVTLPGYNPETLPLPTKTTGSQPTQWAFRIPSINNYKTQVFNPTIQLNTVPAGAPNTANAFSSMGVWIIPASTYMLNGAAITGIYVQPGTSTATAGSAYIIGSANNLVFGTT